MAAATLSLLVILLAAAGEVQLRTMRRSSHGSYVNSTIEGDGDGYGDNSDRKRDNVDDEASDENHSEQKESHDDNDTTVDNEGDGNSDNDDREADNEEDGDGETNDGHGDADKKEGRADITNLDEPVECRRSEISVRDQLQVLKARGGFNASAVGSRTAQNQSLLATSPPYGGRLVHGMATTAGEFPHHALLLADDRVLCSGALLSRSAVLTAAQCVYGYEEWLVQLGSVKLLVMDDARQIIYGKRVETHPGYSKSSVRDDIAVVFLETDADLNSYVKTVRLPTDMIKDDLVDRTGIVAGWGRTDATADCSQDLRYGPLVVDSNENCGTYFPNFNAKTSFCAGGVWGASVCNGDNGSPFIIGTTKGYVVVGVASYVFSVPCLPDFPSVFTRVTNYIDWISETANL